MVHADFFAEVYEIVSRIPKGRVASYGQIAFLLGKPRSARMVGLAMSCAPPDPDLPCHRVVSGSGRLAPGHVFGGPDRQRALLEAEGITFRQNGCIEIGKHRWEFVRPENTIGVNDDADDL